jgi:hypothetical protein
MVCGILGFLTAGLTGLPAVIMGHIGLSQIKKAGGALTGRGMAITGLVTGYLTLIILPIAVIAGLVAPLIVRSQQKAARTEMISNMKQIGLLFLEFDMEFGALPSDETADAVAEATRKDAYRMTGPDVLNQLEAYGIKDLDSLLTVRSAAEGDWIYFPGHKTSDDPGQPILVSPMIQDRAGVLRLDCSVTLVTEAELGKLRASPDGITIRAPRR